MPIFFQQQINETSRLGIWKIEETEEFFKSNVPQHRDVTHPRKRLQHLAGRFLLQYLFPAFPYELIKIADTRKPFLPDEQYHFSISHSGDFAAAIVSRDKRVGIDVENRSPTVMKVLHKFLNESEKGFVEQDENEIPFLRETLLWSVKETIFKWHGNGGVDFSEHIIVKTFSCHENGIIDCLFQQEFTVLLPVNYRIMDELCISWVSSDHTG